jgi:hypothetical protein
VEILGTLSPKRSPALRYGSVAPWKQNKIMKTVLKLKIKNRLCFQLEINLCGSGMESFES